VTTDCGVGADDQWALAHVALSAELDLRGVVTTHSGEFPLLAAPAAESSARVARDVLAQMGLAPAAPVWAGSSTPLRSKTEPRGNPGVEFILRESRVYGSGRRMAVVVIGAATDVASALIIDPSLASRVEIIAMGFNRWPEGGDAFNVRNDPKAWQVVLESGAPVTVGDAEVTTRQLRMTRERAKEIGSGGGGRGRYLADLFVRWVDESTGLAELLGDRHSLPLWDQVAVAHLLGLTRAEVRPRPRLRDDLSFEHPAGVAANVTWITSIDTEKLWRDLSAKLAAAAQR